MIEDVQDDIENPHEKNGEKRVEKVKVTIEWKFSSRKSSQC